MSVRGSIGTLLLAVCLVLVPPSPMSVAQPMGVGSSSAVDDGGTGPVLRTPRAELDAAVRCSPRANRTNARPTVLLVHGTRGTSPSTGFSRVIRLRTPDRTREQTHMSNFRGER